MYKISMLGKCQKCTLCLIGTTCWNLSINQWINTATCTKMQGIVEGATWNINKLFIERKNKYLNDFSCAYVNCGNLS